jgi:hypothetical protein
LQNFPNPFNPATTIRFSIAERAAVSLTVHDLLGREVATLVNESLPPGEYSREFNGVNLPSGIYFVMMKAGNTLRSTKMILQK